MPLYRVIIESSNLITNARMDIGVSAYKCTGWPLRVTVEQSQV